MFRLGLGLRVGLDNPHLIDPAQLVRLGTRNKTSLGLDADLLPQLARLDPDIFYSRKKHRSQQEQDPIKTEADWTTHPRNHTLQQPN